MIAAANRNYPMRAAMLFRIRTPRTLTPEQIQILKVLSAAVLGRLQLRRALHSLARWYIGDVLSNEFLARPSSRPAAL